MGDGGALFLGAAMATATISVGGNSDDPFSGQAWFFFAPLLVPLFILGVPIIDTLFAMVHGRSREEVQQQADHIRELLGDACRGSDILYSSAILKKARLRSKAPSRRRKRSCVAPMPSRLMPT